MIIGGDYLYKRLPFVFEFFNEKDHSDLQLGKDDGTIDQLQKRRRLFEFDCLMMAIDYHGFHQPWRSELPWRECIWGAVRGVRTSDT